MPPMSRAAHKPSEEHLNDRLHRDNFQVSGFGTEPSPDCQNRDEELVLTQVGTSGPGEPWTAPCRPQGDIALVMTGSNHSILSVPLLWKIYSELSFQVQDKRVYIMMAKW